VYPSLHVGWHVDPLARLLVQSPAPPFEGALEASQGFAAHVAAVSVPRLHDDVPDTVYPELHVGWHVDPLDRELVQSPTPPFIGAAEASHGLGEHVAAVTVPALHVDVPDTVYPSLHVGWHVDPLASEFVQSPTPPCVGAAEASHGLGEHVAAVTVPALHVDVPETVYPSLHVGWHVDPLASEFVQSPTPPFTGAAEASQGFPYHALGGPSRDDDDSSTRAYDASHAVATVNITPLVDTEFVFQPKMFALNATASRNMPDIVVTELVSHPEMSALKAVA